MFITLFRSTKDLTASQEGSLMIPPMLRRRLTSFGRGVMAGFYHVLPDLQERSVTQDVQWVISCRHGDTHRMNQLLLSLSHREILSPTDFSFSVHNALVALFSIETKNTQNNTALAGGERSFEMGLAEAYALAQTTNQPVGYFYYDMPLPEIYQEHEETPSRSIMIMMIIEKKPFLDDDASVRYEQDTMSEPSSDLIENYEERLSQFFSRNKQNDFFRIPLPAGFFLLERARS